jgi:hypothetical protein
MQASRISNPRLPESCGEGQPLCPRSDDARISDDGARNGAVPVNAKQLPSVSQAPGSDRSTLQCVGGL